MRIRDPESFWPGIRHLGWKKFGSGINIPPQHCLWQFLKVAVLLIINMLSGRGDQRRGRVGERHRVRRQGRGSAPGPQPGGYWREGVLGQRVSLLFQGEHRLCPVFFTLQVRKQLPRKSFRVKMSSYLFKSSYCPHIRQKHVINVKL